MDSLRFRKLLLALLVLGGLTLTGFAILHTPAQAVQMDVQEIHSSRGSQAPLGGMAAPALILTHTYTPTLTFISAVGGEGGYLVEGNGYAYVGDGTQLSFVDVSEPAVPRRVARIAQRGAICQMQLIDSRLIVAANYGGLRIYDISDPEHPRLLGTYADGHNICPFQAAGNLVYAIEGQNFQLIDFNNPTIPFLRGVVAVNYAPYYNIILVGNTVFAGANTIDVTNPDQLEIGTTITGTWNAVEGTKAVADTVSCFKGSCWGGMVFYNISNPANPVRSGEYRTDTPFGRALIEGDNLYFTDYQINILDISQPLIPILLSTFPGEIFEIDGDWLYAGNRIWDDINREWLFSLEVVDISDHAKPELVGSSPALSDIIYNYSRSGDTIILRGITKNRVYHKLQLIDIGDYSNPMLAGKSYEKDLFSVGETLVEGDRAYVLAYTPFFHILDFSNAALPESLGSHTVTNEVLSDLSIVEDIAYMIGAGQVKVVDIHDPSQPIVIQTYGGSGNNQSRVYQAQILDNHRGYLVVDDWAYFRSNLQIVQFNPPAQPSVQATYSISPNHYIRALDGTAERVFVALDDGAVELLDTHNPTSPTLISVYSSTQVVSAIRQAGDLVLLGGDGKLAIIDFSNPISPTLAGELAMPCNTDVYDIQIDGGWAYVAVGDCWAVKRGMWVVDISDPANPTILDIYPTTALQIQIQGGLAYLSAASNGLHVVNLFEPSMYLPQVLSRGP